MLRQEMGRGSSVRSKIRRLAIIERNPAGKVLCHKKIRISGQNPNISQPYVISQMELLLQLRVRKKQEHTSAMDECQKNKKDAS